MVPEDGVAALVAAAVAVPTLGVDRADVAPGTTEMASDAPSLPHEAKVNASAHAVNAIARRDDCGGRSFRMSLSHSIFNHEHNFMIEFDRRKRNVKAKVRQINAVKNGYQVTSRVLDDAFEPVVALKDDGIFMIPSQGQLSSHTEA